LNDRTIAGKEFAGTASESNLRRRISAIGDVGLSESSTSP
jgi:hypothetical protein